MNKFFRKYNKWLLAIFGSGLMVIFLMPEIPSLVSGMGQGRAVVGTIDGESITRNELINIQNQAQLVDRQGLQLPFIGIVDTWEQWYLLVREAKQAGMIGGNVTSRISTENAVAISRNTGIPPQTVIETFTNWTGISNYLSHLATSTPMSDRRMRLEGRRLFDAADVEVVSLKADMPTEITPPSEEEIQAHLDAWGDVNPGTGDHGFGYRLPDRVTIEWMKIPSKTIRASLDSSDEMNEIALRKYWRRNEADNDIPPVEAGTDVPEIVRTRLLNDLSEKRRAEIKRVTADRLRAPRRGFTESDGFVVLPDDWNDRRLSMEDLAEELQIEYEIEMPEVTRSEKLVEINQLRVQPGIGLANTDKYGQRPISLSDLISEGKEFGGTGLYPIQLDVAGPILEDRQNNLYAFRIIEADASRAPSSVDEVRPQLVEDLNRLAHYEEMKNQIEQVRTEARANGLDSLASSNNARIQAASLRQYDPRFAQIFLQNQNSLPKSPQVIPGLGEDEDVVEGILETSSGFEIDGSLADLPKSERIDVYLSEDNLALVVVQINKRTPITLDEFTQMTSSGLLPTIIQMDEMDGESGLVEAFSLEALMERNNFVPATNDSAEDEESATTNAETPSSDETPAS